MKMNSKGRNVCTDHLQYAGAGHATNAMALSSQAGPLAQAVTAADVQRIVQHFVTAAEARLLAALQQRVNAAAAAGVSRAAAAAQPDHSAGPVATAAGQAAASQLRDTQLPDIELNHRYGRGSQGPELTLLGAAWDSKQQEPVSAHNSSADAAGAFTGMQQPHRVLIVLIMAAAD